MNFFKRKFFAAEGDYWSWKRAINYQPTTYEEKQSYVYIIGIPKGYK